MTFPRRGNGREAVSTGLALLLNDELKAILKAMSRGDLVVVQSYATEGEAAVAKGILESSGIDAMIQADTAGRMRDHLAWSGLGHRVRVREEDAAEAQKLLAPGR
jgi:hypothetical protein